MSDYKDQIYAKIQELNTKMAALQVEFRAEGARLFKEGAREIFDKNPALESFAWAQGTPGFCDGEPCYFRARVDDEENFWINDLEIGDVKGGYYAGRGVFEEYTDWRGAKQQREVKDWVETVEEGKEALAPLFTLVCEFVSQIDSDILENTFGDGVKVIVKRDGNVETDEYYFDQHD